MKAPDDTKTIDMLGGLPAKRGRPVTGNALTAAERKAKSRKAKSATHGTFTVSLPLDVLADFREFLKFKDTTQEVVLERLLRSQLLRKR